MQTVFSNEPCRSGSPNEHHDGKETEREKPKRSSRNKSKNKVNSDSASPNSVTKPLNDVDADEKEDTNGTITKVAVKKEESKKQPSSFIHKLYSMIEETSMDNLIWWHENNSNFFVCPNEEFINKLSNYFKHANIASFIRQLNMYGFHKVDNSHNNNNNNNNNNVENADNSGESKATPKLKSSNLPNLTHSNSSSISNLNQAATPVSTPTSNSNSTANSSTIWEFKHSSGVFKKGNVESLNTIKRRSFKNSLTDKDGNMKLTYDLPPNIQTNPIQMQQHQTSHDSYRYNQHPPQNTTLIDVNHHHRPNIHDQHIINHPQIQQLQLQTQQHSPSQQQPQEQQQHNHQHHQQQQQEPAPVMNQPLYHHQHLQNQHPNLTMHQTNSGSDINNSNAHEFNENVLIQPNQDRGDHERQLFSSKIRDLQISNSNLNQKYYELARQVEDLMRLNEIYREELLSVNYDCVTSLDSLKDYYSHVNPPPNGLVSNIGAIRLKILQRMAYRDMTIKNIFCQANQYPTTNSNVDNNIDTNKAIIPSNSTAHNDTIDPNSQTNPTSNPTPPNDNTNVSTQQYHSHYLPQEGLNPQQKPPLNANAVSQSHVISVPQQHPQNYTTQQIRHGSIPQQNVYNFQQQSIVASSMNNAQRNPSNTSLTSNPYFNFNYQPTSAIFGYFPEYSQQQQHQQPQQQQQQPQQQQQQQLPNPTSVTSKQPIQDSNSSKTNTGQPVQQTSYNKNVIRNTPNKANIPNAPTSNPHNSTFGLSNNNNTHYEEPLFLHKDIRYSISMSSSGGRSRNPSVYDPLQPLPFPAQQMVSTTQQNTMINYSGIQNGYVPFYPANQMNNNHSNVDPSVISRQYSLAQMYSPVSYVNSSSVVSQKNNENEIDYSTNNNSHSATSSNNNSTNTTTNSTLPQIMLNHSNESNNGKRFAQHGGYNSRTGSLSHPGSSNGSRHGSFPGMNLNALRSLGTSVSLRSPDGKSKNLLYNVNVRTNSFAQTSLNDQSKDKKDTETNKKIDVQKILNYEDKQQNNPDRENVDEEGDGEEEEEDDDDEEDEGFEDGRYVKRAKI